MDSYELKSNLNRHKQSARIEMENSLNSIIDSQRKTIINNAIDIFQNYINLQPEIIENIVENQLLPRFSKSSHDITQKNTEKVESLTDSVARISINKGIKEIESTFTMLSNEFIRNQDLRLLEEDVYEFCSFINRRVSSLSLPVVSAQSLESIANDISFDLQKFLMDITSVISKQYCQDLDKILERYRNQSLKVIDNYKNEQVNTITVDDLQPFRDAISLTGNKVREFDDVFFFVDEITKEKTPILKNADGSLSNNDGSLIISIADGNTKIVNQGQTAIVQATGVILGTISNPHAMEIRFGFDTYEFYMDSILQTSPYKMNEVLTTLKKSFPAINSRLMESTSFRTMCDEISKKVNYNASLFIDTPNVSKSAREDSAKGKPLDFEEEIAKIVGQNAAAFKTDEDIEKERSQINAEKLINELDAETIQPDVTQSEEKSLDDQIFELEQNPIVQQYLNLVKQRENDLSNAAKFIL